MKQHRVSEYGALPRPWLSFDLETCGEMQDDGKCPFALQPWRVKQGRAWITTYALSWRDEKGLLKTEGAILQQGEKVDAERTYQALLEIMRQAVDMEARVVGWNMTFDLAWCAAYALTFDDSSQQLWKLICKLQWLDAMRLWRHLDSTPTYAGKRSWTLDLANQKFEKSYAGYKAVGPSLYFDPSPAARAKLLAYNKGDTEATLLHAERFWPQLTEKQQHCALIEASAMPHVAKANVFGMEVDLEAREILSNTLREAGHEVARAMAPLGVTEAIVRSPVKMATLLYKKWGIEPIKYNEPSEMKIAKAEAEGKPRPVGTPSTDKEVLYELGIDDKRVYNLQLWRDALNLNSKFMGGLRKSCDYNDEGNVTYPQANLYGTYTGRMTYSSKQGRGEKNELPIGFAIHQMKRDERFRNCIVAPEGYDLVEFDAAGQEFRWMAIKSGDPTMLDLCEPGGDPHSYMTAAIYHWDYAATVRRVKEGEKEAKNGRKLGKVANLCCSQDTPILTNRGYVYIQDVRKDDLVWDGIEFVAHDGVMFSGTFEVITHDALTTTPDHVVFVDDQEVEMQDAARHGWRVQSALGTGWFDRGRTAVRIVGGIVTRAGAEAWRALSQSKVHMWSRRERQRPVPPKWAVSWLPIVRAASSACGGRAPRKWFGSGSAASTTCRSYAAEMCQPERSVLQELRSPWDRVSAWLGARSGRAYQGTPTAPDVSSHRHRSSGQRWPLRSGEFETCHSTGEPLEQARRQSRLLARCKYSDVGVAQSLFADMHYALCGAGAFWRRYPAPSSAGCTGKAQGMASDRREVATYDIVNCGPRHRFTANGRLVHNSLQYRTSKKKLRVVARVQYGLPMTEEDAEHVHKTYGRTYTYVPRYWKDQITLGKQLGYAETLAGRRVQVIGDWDGDYEWSMGSTMINFPIQGTGGDQKYLALRCLESTIVEHGAVFAWDLHDGLYFYVPKAKTMTFVTKAKSILDNLPYKRAWDFVSPIPLPWDCKVGRSWGDMKELEL